MTGSPGASARQCLAIDIGGTKIAAALVDAAGRLSGQHRIPTRAHEGPQVLWADLARLVGRVLRGGDGSGTWEGSATAVVAVGVGCGGPMDPGGEAVSPLNIPAWRDFPLRGRLEELTGVPVFVDNDGKALALGEGRAGAASGQRDFMAMVVSTGVGGGIVLDGRLLDGARSNAGHVGHIVVEPDGHLCPCGSRGCLEAEASGTAIARDTGRPAAEAPPEVVTRVGTMVGRAVASVANLLDLQLAVVAGSVALGFGEPFFVAAQAEVAARCRIAFARGTRVVPAGLGGDGPLVGAGAVAWSALERTEGARR